MSGNRRMQQQVTVPIKIQFTKSDVGMFGSFVAILAVSLITLVVFWYGMSRRREATSAENDKSGNKTTTIMILSSITQLIMSIIGLTYIHSNWYIMATILAIVSLYPLYKLRKTPNGRITRLQFRKISQQCLAVLFLWLYTCGSGIAVSLSSPIQSFSGVIDFEAYAQIVGLIIAHLGFSVLSAIIMYLHLSVTDILGSYLKTASTPPYCEDVKKVDGPVVAPVVAEEKVERKISWNSEKCASCSTNRANTVLVPCGHSVVCDDCARALLSIPGFKCPVCCIEVFDLL